MVLLLLRPWRPVGLGEVRFQNKPSRACVMEGRLVGAVLCQIKADCNECHGDVYTFIFPGEPCARPTRTSNS